MPKSAKQNTASEISKPINSAPPIVSAGEVVNYRDSWRIFRIITEFVEGYQFLADLKKEVTILGSARIPSNNKYYKVAEELGYLLGKMVLPPLPAAAPVLWKRRTRARLKAEECPWGLTFNCRLNSASILM